ncbi:hypothetical protein [Kistimonas asteriae]|uniref:hypothetical protein n=1 Tax=Kistimonas asteriae TaxID=517724 RepID=UPI001BA5FAA2|nr:hypothetical protein [Kistimonas asteriae]
MKFFPIMSFRQVVVSGACLFVSGCVSLTPVTYRSSIATINHETVQITSSFNEMLANHLSVKLNGTLVIDQSIGNPLFPEYEGNNEKYMRQPIVFKPVSGEWQTKTVIAECGLGTPSSTLLRPVCLIKVDGKDVADFSF